MKKKIKLLFAVTLCCLSCASLLAQTIESAANLYNQSSDAIKNKDYPAALSDLQKCITMCDALGTEDALELKEKAESVVFQCNYAYSTELIRLKKFDEALPVLKIAETMALQEQEKGVIGDYATEVLRKIKANKSAIFAKQAKDAYEAAQYDSVIMLATQALQEKPDNTTAFFYRGRAYEKKGDLAKMEEDFSQCINLTRDNPKEVNITESVKKSARSAYIKESQQYIQIAQKCSPEEETKKIENLELALSLLKKAELYDSDANTYYHLALVNNGLKKYQDALNAANAGLPMETKNQSNFYFMIGQAYEGLGNIDKACENYKLVREGGFVKPAGFQRDQVIKCKD